MPSTLVGPLTIALMIGMFFAVPWLAGKLLVQPRSFPESPWGTTLPLAAAAVLGYATPRSTDEVAWFTAIFCILFAGTALGMVIFYHTFWLEPLRKWSYPRAGMTLILGRLSMICLSAAVLFGSIQLHPVDLGRSIWGVLELMTWLTGILTWPLFLGLLGFAVVMHRREQKAAAAAKK